MRIETITVDKYKELINETGQGYAIPVAPETAGMFNRFILGGFDDSNRLTHAVVIEPRKAMKIKKYAHTGGDWISADKDADRAFLDGVSEWLTKNRYILWQLESSTRVREYDKEGEIVPNGFDNRDFLDFMTCAGFLWMDLGSGSNDKHQWTWHAVTDLKDFQDDGHPLHRNDDPCLTVEEVESRMNRKKRYLIRRAIKDGYHAKLYYGDSIQDKAWKEFRAVTVISSAYHNFDVADEKHTREIVDAFGKNAVIVTVYDKEDRPAFSGLFLFTNTEAVYLYSGMDREVVSASASVAKLAHHTMFQEAISRGMMRYNFAGISGNFKEGEEGFGVYSSKKEMGARVCRAFGPFNKPLTMAGKFFLNRLT